MTHKTQLQVRPNAGYFVLSLQSALLRRGHALRAYGRFVLYDQQTWEQESSGALKLVFENGQVYNRQTITEVRERLLLIREECYDDSRDAAGNGRGSLS